METKIKWAEVAHYYAASGIEISLIPYTINQFMTGLVEVNKCIYTASSIYPGGGCDYKYPDNPSARGSASVNQYLPILRALEDMTEEEAREIVLRFTHYAKFADTPAARQLAMEAIHNRLWTLGDVIGLAHYLISKGFDVFGLIASGQAIRKSIG